ncbi:MULTISPECIES: putative 2-aminoethylphosphonate ABC transporter permease subunit [unclassified Undibacterium]|nr:MULTISPECIES: putative 2-aminoethylphosphonate ABC transporter permease subunit [unclassified Undibacterium]MEB0139982.1 putative 2-aminoethylphosphonate ABC transporter permease subunit [Undibacterium sp. CCC2.1]MEB0173002.1 putative 2-aminoethylphosphonate ABC transporter permease subunit [Undibacterium sp. CCC1.1]MEB0176844.1 putative 2-aminoethylphosphonate ABC transporter permease subunit [Undibacterium sp. CCC3.4]MEB0216076.1 putative 2-aminoethylphosphonate ABC transporter permease su
MTLLRSSRHRLPAFRSIDEKLAVWLVGIVALLMLAFIASPLLSMFSMTTQARNGSYVGLANWTTMLMEPRLRIAAGNSIALGMATLVIVLPLALAFAFALTRTRLLGRRVFRLIALTPMLAPSLMPAISLVYLFGNQGLLKNCLAGASIYGPIGIILGEVFYTFPHALLILTTALSVSDSRLYEAAETLGASKFRRFLTVTLPNARYGLVSAAMLVFTLVVTDFGIPKVIGGQMNVLSLEAYKQVIGQQNFNKGAVIGVLLLLPAVLSFMLERWLSRHRTGQMSGRSVVYQPRRNHLRDVLLWLLCAGTSVCFLALLGVGCVAAFIKMWPYDMSLTWSHFDFEQLDGGGWLAFLNSMRLATLVTIFGTGFIFISAYLIEKLPVPAGIIATIRSLALLPMAVPGLVLGLGYVLCFNAPSNPLHFLYGTMSLMVVATIAHFYTTAHLTLTTSLRQSDSEIEAVARSLQRPWWHTFLHVTLPINLPAVFNVARYLFISSMTTVSCIIFLYTPDTVLAAVAILNMDDAGDTAAAAAMATLIVISSLLVSALMHGAGWWLSHRGQAWRRLSGLH